jgi:hypothetical protein
MFLAILAPLAIAVCAVVSFLGTTNQLEVVSVGSAFLLLALTVAGAFIER